jgi:hypothetical protein
MSRDSVMRLMPQFDPEGTNERKAEKGPYFVWHVYGYDKSKLYGFCIHGAIDGYSRSILCLEVSNSNNLPALIASYYIDTLNELGILQKCIFVHRSGLIFKSSCACMF